MDDGINVETMYTERPMLNPDDHEKYCESLAYRLAEQQLERGTAGTQIIVHFLKLATAREQYETKKLEAEVRLAEAKIQMMESSQRSEEATNRVLEALRKYQGYSYED